MNKIFLEKESYAICGAVFTVYREMGCGFLESVYQECLEIELRKSGIPFKAQKQLELYYQGQLLSQTYRPDFICFDSIIVEIKALSSLSGEHKSQVMNYLKATGYKLGLLVNFGCFPKASVDRIVL